MARLIRLLTSASAAVVLILALAQPAAAYPYWQAFTTDSNWRCGSTMQHPAATNVYYQACVVVTSANYMQTVLVASNQSSNTVTIRGKVSNSSAGTQECNQSAFSPGYRRACFGATTYVGCTAVVSAVYFWVNYSEVAATAPDVDQCSP